MKKDSVGDLSIPELDPGVADDYSLNRFFSGNTSPTGVNGFLINDSYKHLPWDESGTSIGIGSRTLADSRGVADHDQLNPRCVSFA
jgi:hypothetical protein